MRLRAILLVLSLLAFFSAGVAGYQYYASSKRSALKEADRKALLKAEALRNRISSFLSENMKPARILAGLAETREALNNNGDMDHMRANAVLDHFNEALRADVCYLIDQEGNTVATSNRKDPDSFLGQNYAFRPYFKKAIHGFPAIYMALGVTSKKRGVYYSCPIYGNGKENPLGVAVIKTGIDSLEKEFPEAYEGIVLLTDPEGMIFMSNRKNLLYHLLWELPPQKASEIAKSKQFGSGPWKWSGFAKEDSVHAQDESGKRYLIRETPILNYPGWQIVFLQDPKSISARIFNPLLRTTLPVIVTLFVLVVGCVFFLYRKASHDILRRRAAEEALKKSEETALALLNAPTESALLVDKSGKILALNTEAVKALGKPADELVGMNVYGQFTTDVARTRRIHHEEVIKSGKPVRYQDVREGRWRDSNLYPVLDEHHQVVRVAIFSRDITEQKESEQALRKAKDTLSQYSRELEIQVRERTEEITSILENTPAVVFVKDSNLQYRLVNSRFEELFGIKKSGIRGKTDDDIFPDQIAAMFLESDLKILKEKRPIQVEEQIPLADGMHTYLSVKFPIFDEKGSAQSICSIATDITELKDAQDRLRRLGARIMDGQEEERAAIARELHDELGQMLTALRMESAWLHKKLETKLPDAGERAGVMSDLIDKTIDDVRRMALRLRPKVLDDLGIIDAVDWYMAEFEKRSGIAAIFKHKTVPPLNSMLSTALYRIVQEALTNVARHAHATHVDVNIKMVEALLVLSIMDNGCGFDPKKAMKSEGLGIAGMRERAILAGGTLDIQSRTGEGTRIVFSVPLTGQQEHEEDDQGTAGG